VTEGTGAASRLSIGVMLAGAGAGGSDVVRVCGVAVLCCGGKQMYHYSSVVACSWYSAMVGLLPILSLQNIAINICTI